MKRVPISIEQALHLIGGRAGGVVLMQEFQHDSWCRTLKTGNGNDCNCDPWVQFYEFVDDDTPQTPSRARRATP